MTNQKMHFTFQTEDGEIEFNRGYGDFDTIFAIIEDAYASIARVYPTAKMISAKTIQE